MSVQTIHKYPLRIDDRMELLLPDGARPLCVQMQGDTPCLWALVDPNAPMQRRAVWCRGTGHDASGVDADWHIGTVQLHGGSLIFHFFLIGGGA